MSEDNNSVDEYGSEPISSIEVNQEPAQAENEQDSAQENKAPEAIPYERFQKVNSEKNEWKTKYDELQGNINEYLANTNRQSAYEQQNAVKETQVPEINSVEDMMQYIEKKVEERVKPIEQQRAVDMYDRTVNNFFETDAEAKALKSDIDSYYDALPNYRKKQVVEAVSFGDTSVLQEIKNTVALKKQASINNMTNQAVNADAQRTVQPSAAKVVRSGEPGFRDIMTEAKKTGNFTDVFKAMVS